MQAKPAATQVVKLLQRANYTSSTGTGSSCISVPTSCISAPTSCVAAGTTCFAATTSCFFSWPENSHHTFKCYPPKPFFHPHNLNGNSPVWVPAGIVSNSLSMWHVTWTKSVKLPGFPFTLQANQPKTLPKQLGNLPLSRETVETLSSFLLKDLSRSKLDGLLQRIRMTSITSPSKVRDAVGVTAKPQLCSVGAM